ncbi:hypothetical protein ACOZ38_24940 [Sphaerisporangium viridialbum]|uniref:hypothetical protein n=1 Tax=Sphaerisporangium viridialbum TaxID=46189 RepID=UPI003C741A71
MPAPTAVVAGKAEIPEEQRQEWHAACVESARLAEEIHRHSWWDGVDDRHSADMQLLKLAKAE